MTTANRKQPTMKRKPGTNGERATRERTRVGAQLEKLLTAYAGGALAAGVGLLAVTRSAEAKVVYTPAHTVIPVDNQSSVVLDLNHDGVDDFSFVNFRVIAGEGGFLGLDVGCASSGKETCNDATNRVWNRGGFVYALRAGSRIGPSKTYFQQNGKGRSYHRGPLSTMAATVGSYARVSYSYGQWWSTKGKYLGFQFGIEGKIHYGWARLNVGLGKDGIHAVITGYAYETVPNKPIVTGKTKGLDVVTLEPPTLGKLAQGASGISAWRERK
jgi:hypothetical protein